MKIAVIGSTMMDIVSYTDEMPQAGETRRVNGFHIASGGKGANQAIAAAKLGADVVMMTAVGDDMFGERSRRNFQDHHIDMSLVKTAEGTSNGIATIVVDATGQNRILINPGANEKLSPADIEAAGDELSMCGLFVLQLEVPLETVYAAIRFAKAHGIKVLLNPAPASRDLSLDMACQCDFFVPNETELSILVDKPVDTVEQVREAAESLVERGLTNVIVAQGRCCRQHGRGRCLHRLLRRYVCADRGCARLDAARFPLRGAQRHAQGHAGFIRRCQRVCRIP